MFSSKEALIHSIPFHKKKGYFSKSKADILNSNIRKDGRYSVFHGKDYRRYSMIQTSNINEPKHKIYTYSFTTKGDSIDSFSKILDNKSQAITKDKRPCEYFRNADSTGAISYGRATFMCDKENNRLLLGDCSDEKNCLRIKLSGGGSLVVNRDNLDELVQSISMFSAKDQGLIMRAIQQDKIAQKARDYQKTDSLMDELPS